MKHVICTINRCILLKWLPNPAALWVKNMTGKFHEHVPVALSKWLPNPELSGDRQVCAMVILFMNMYT